LGKRAVYSLVSFDGGSNLATRQVRALCIDISRRPQQRGMASLVDRPHYGRHLGITAGHQQERRVA